MKRGQITVFLIIGVLMLFVTAGVFFVVNKVSTVNEEIEIIDKSKVKFFVDSCINILASEAVLENSKQGGYFLLPEHSTSDLLVNVPYYYDYGSNFIPSNTVIVNEIASYIDFYLLDCLDNFETFEEKGVVIEFSEWITNVKLINNKLDVETLFPLEIKQGDQVTEMSNFLITLNVERFLSNLKIAREVASSVEGGSVCMTCFSDLASENNVFVGVLPISDDTILFEMKDNDFLIDNEPFEMNFAVRYNEE